VGALDALIEQIEANEAAWRDYFERYLQLKHSSSLRA
jgi:hypothetical protein